VRSWLVREEASSWCSYSILFHQGDEAIVAGGIDGIGEINVISLNALRQASDVVSIIMMIEVHKPNFRIHNLINDNPISDMDATIA